MEKFNFAVSLLVAIFLIFACGDVNKDSSSSSKQNKSGLPTFTINIECDGQFDGNIGVTDKDYKYSSKSVNGNKRDSYQYEARNISVVFQKKSEYGRLKVEIKKDGSTVKTESTTAPYGVISLTQ